jgi:uncharacterized membrane protein
MPKPHKSAHKRSDPGLDIHRGFAVVLMFLAHAWRVQDHYSPQGFGWLDRTLAWMDRGVAYVAASFLFIAGFSLVLAHRDAIARGRTGWLLALLQRAGWLYFLSLLMFLPEHGVQWPDLLTSSGILSVIAVAVAVTATAMVSPQSNLVLAIASVAVLVVTYLLERAGLPVSGLNAGPGGAIPLVMFSTLGALCGRLYLHRGVRGLFVVCGVALPVFAAALIHDERWLAFYTSVYSDHGGLAIADWLGMTTPGTGTVSLTFWNPSALGALGLIAPVVATTAGLLAIQKRVAGSRALWPLLMLGRHALFVFVAHYGLLGLVDLSGLQPPHAGWTLVLLLALTVASVGMSVAVEAWGKNPSTSTARAPLR